MSEKELVERLRAEVEYDNDEADGSGKITYGRVFAEAADALEAKDARIAELEELLDSIAAEAGFIHLGTPSPNDDLDAIAAKRMAQTLSNVVKLALSRRAASARGRE